MRVYIHIPFCVKKCPYCAFGSICEFDLVKKYFLALQKDLKFWLSFAGDKKIKSIFFGGGTPSAIKAEFYEPLMQTLLKNCTKNCEITFEANPNSANKIWLKDIYKFGANRISFGAQSFFEKKLKFLGRVHNSYDIFNAVYNAKEVGFKNINIDLMYGTKIDNKKLLSFELENIKKLDINHLSLYSLNIEEETEFFSHQNFQKSSPNLAKFLFSSLNDLGFNQYEISNFCKNNKICRHNAGYWRGDDYIGVGAFSVGTIDKIRFYAKDNLKEYIKNPLFRNKEILNNDKIAKERIFLGLRSNLGLSKKYIKNHKNLEILLKNNKLKEKNNKIFNENFLLADELAISLF